MTWTGYSRTKCNKNKKFVQNHQIIIIIIKARHFIISKGPGLFEVEEIVPGLRTGTGTGLWWVEDGDSVLSLHHQLRTTPHPLRPQRSPVRVLSVGRALYFSKIFDILWSWLGTRGITVNLPNPCVEYCPLLCRDVISAMKTTFFPLLISVLSYSTAITALHYEPISWNLISESFFPRHLTNSNLKFCSNV